MKVNVVLTIMVGIILIAQFNKKTSDGIKQIASQKCQNDPVVKDNKFLDCVIKEVEKDCELNKKDLRICGRLEMLELLNKHGLLK